LKKILVGALLTATIPAIASAQETPRPSVDVSRTRTDVPRPNVDVPRTRTDTGIKGPAEISRPGTDTMRPRMESTTGSLLPSRPRGN